MSEFRALTFNVFKFGSPVPADRVIERILALDADLLGLQEVFNTPLRLFGFQAHNAKKLLSRRLEEAGYAPLWLATSGPGPFGPLTFGKFRDGLLLAISTERWELDPERDYFSTHLPSGMFDRRGLQCALVRNRESSQRLAFCNLHLSVGSSEGKRKRRREQVLAALEFVHAIELTHHPAATVLLGDFNALDTSPEIAELTAPATPGSVRFQDTWRDLNPHSAPGFTRHRGNTVVARRPPKGEEEGSRRIDYIFLRPEPGSNGAEAALMATGASIVLDEVDAETGENLSDHYGVLATVRWAET